MVQEDYALPQRLGKGDFLHKQDYYKSIHSPELLARSVDLDKVRQFLRQEGIDLSTDNIVCATEEDIKGLGLSVPSIAWVDPVTGLIFLIPGDPILTEGALVHESVHASEHKGVEAVANLPGDKGYGKFTHSIVTGLVGMAETKEEESHLSTGVFFEEGLANYLQGKYLAQFGKEPTSESHRRFSKTFTRVADAFNKKLPDENFIELVKQARKTSTGFLHLKELVTSAFNEKFFDILMMLGAEYQHLNDDANNLWTFLDDIVHYLRLLDKDANNEAANFLDKVFIGILKNEPLTT